MAQPSYFLSPALVQLRTETNTAYPGRAKVSDGWIGDTSHAARPSDHNPDPSGPDKGEVRAIDVTQWDPGTPKNPNDDVAEALAEHLRRTKDPRVLYVIWRGRMFSSYATSKYAAWEWRPYTGSNGHFHHVHVSVKPGSGGGSWGFKAVATHRQWLPFTTGATDASLTTKGGLTHQVTEWQLILKALSIRWQDPKLDPGAVDGRYGNGSGKATARFKQRIRAMQRAFGQPVWPDETPYVGPATVGMGRYWNNITA